MAQGTPQMQASVCRMDDGRLLVSNANVGSVDAHVGMWVNGNFIGDWGMPAGTGGGGPMPGDVHQFRFAWFDGEGWNIYLNVNTDNANLCNEPAEAPAPAVVILVDPDGVLPNSYPHELLTQGGTFWDQAEVWYNDVFDVVGWTIYDDVYSGFADGFAWLHATNGDDIYIELMPDPDERTGQWMARVVAYYPGGYPG